MSSAFTSREYHCSNDCRQSGCPGHVIELRFNHTSDTVTITEDDKYYVTFDKTQWRVLVNLDRELRERK